MIKSLTDLLFKLRICYRLLLSKRTVCLLSDREVSNVFAHGTFNIKDFVIMILELTRVILNNLPEDYRLSFLNYIENGDYIKDVKHNMFNNMESENEL